MLGGEQHAVPEPACCLRLDRNAATFRHLIAAPYYLHDPPVAYVGKPVTNCGGSALRQILETLSVSAIVTKSVDQDFSKEETSVPSENVEPNDLSNDHPEFPEKFETDFKKTFVSDIQLQHSGFSVISRREPRRFSKEVETVNLWKKQKSINFPKKREQVSQPRKTNKSYTSKKKKKGFSNKLQPNDLHRDKPSFRPKNMGPGILPKETGLLILLNNKHTLFEKEVEMDSQPEDGAVIPKETVVTDSQLKDGQIVAQKEAKPAIPLEASVTILPKSESKIFQKKVDAGILQKWDESKLFAVNIEPGNVPGKTDAGTVSKKERDISPNMVKPGILLGSVGSRNVSKIKCGIVQEEVETRALPAGSKLVVQPSDDQEDISCDGPEGGASRKHKPQSVGTSAHCYCSSLQNLALLESFFSEMMDEMLGVVRRARRSLEDVVDFADTVVRTDPQQKLNRPVVMDVCFSSSHLN